MFITQIPSLSDVGISHIPAPYMSRPLVVALVPFLVCATPSLMWTACRLKIAVEHPEASEKQRLPADPAATNVGIHLGDFSASPSTHVYTGITNVQRVLNHGIPTS
jgi:hypothetical protein